ncbi:MAG: cytochrome C [Pseudomonadota bacterium]
MSKCLPVTLLAASTLAFALSAQAKPPPAESRGELLYSTHCTVCHTAQTHWRDKKRATDWPSLKAEVQRWQAMAMLKWSEEDVLDVTRYLNDTYYRFEQTPLSSLDPRPTN